ncbi:MAG: FecR domain-containing protein [Minwuia sp.]|uniref:FecR domain-containing protein n=1 Tax=Minwuia sp. TaxID=2493630 RepID=UPI003A836F77
MDQQGAAIDVSSESVSTDADTGVVAAPDVPAPAADARPVQAQSQQLPDGAVISSIRGEVMIISVDGTQGQAEAGQVLQPGDVVITHGDGALELRLADGSGIFFDSESRVLIEEPPQPGQKPQFFVIQGEFSVDNTGSPDAPASETLVRTPVASLTVKGARMVGKAAPEAQANVFVLLPGIAGAAAGSIAVASSGAPVVIDQPLQGLQVLSLFRDPTPLDQIDASVLSAEFGDGVLAWSDADESIEVADSDGDDLLGDLGALFGIGEAQAEPLLIQGDGVIGSGDGEDDVLGGADDDILDNEEDEVIEIDQGQGDNVAQFDGALDINIANGDFEVTGGAGDDTLNIAADPVNANTVSFQQDENGKVVVVFAGGINSTVTIDEVETVAVNLGAAGDAVEIGSLENTDISQNTVFFDLAAGNDTLNAPQIGRSLNITAGSGNDLIQGGNQNDSIDGGADNDTISYADAGVAVNVDLAAGTGAGFGNDTLLNFENVIGSGQNDTIAGNSGDNLLDGGAGTDTADFSAAAAGVDANLATGLATGDGNDTLTAFENLIGSVNNDTLTGDANDNIFAGGLGDDSMDGGAGTDTIDFSGSAAAVTVDLGAGSATGEGTDTLAGFEVVIGSAQADALTGSAAGETLFGGAGDDTLAGADGNDSLGGGDGAADRAVFAGNLANFSASFDETTVDLLVEDTVGGGGLDTVGSDVEQVAFDDITLAVSVGSAAADSLSTGDGDVVLGGLAGNDTLTGGAGRNALLGGTGADSLSGAGGADTVVGEDGNDTLSGGDGADLVSGGDGDDLITADAGNDTLSGDGGTDTLDFQSIAVAVTANLGTGTSTSTATGTDQLSGIENLIGGSASDSLTGDSQANVLSGNAGSDTLSGGAGNDTLSGGNGTDRLTGGEGDDSIDGGAGNDTVSFAGAASGVTVDLAEGLATGQGTDTLSSIEAVLGSANADTVTGGIGDETIDGGGGDDILDGGAGTNTLSFASSAVAVTVNLSVTDSQNTNNGNVTQSGFANLIGSDVAAGDTLTGDINANVISGGVGADLIDGGAGNDSLIGGNGFDTMIGGLGNDTMDGGNGTDTADYTSSVTQVTVDLTAGTATGAAIGTDSLISVERIIGTAAEDAVSGSNQAEIFLGAAGNDTLQGLGGADNLNGGDGNDLIEGGSGNDTLVGGNNDDTLDGGADNDTADYSNEASEIDLDLAAGTATGTSIGTDSLIGIETVIGGQAADTLAGDAQANALFGGLGGDSLSGVGGNDTLDGGIGADTLNGGSGADSMTGGDGADAFFYDTAEDHQDVIADFVAGTDRFLIDNTAFNIASLNGTSLVDGQSFVTVGESLVDGVTALGTNEATFVFDSDSNLHFDPDGDGATASFEIGAVTVSSGTLSATDFEVQ